MLIEFRVKNFKSIRDEQVLSLVASSDKTLEHTHIFETGIPAAPRLVRSAVIYGANASGKSTVVRALQYMQILVTQSSKLAPEAQFKSLQSFRLDETTVNEPSEFEVTFVVNGTRFQYGFAVNSTRVVSEHLLVYKASKPQKWFERFYDSEVEKYTYSFSASLKGPKHIWEGATRKNTLFLSMASLLNSAQIAPIFNWFANNLAVSNELAPMNPAATVRELKQPDRRKAIITFLNAADTSIVDVAVVRKLEAGVKFSFQMKNGNVEPTRDDIQIEAVDNAEIDHIQFHHVTDAGKAVFEMADESSGTRNLLFLAAPILNILQSGITLIVDELDTSLHPLLVRHLVALFHRPDINTGGAQLIFTTHDTSLLDANDLFRRDQIWFVEKDRDQASSLYSLSDFSPRKNEALERGYLQGRYGAVPFFEQAPGAAQK